jgi:ATP synthase protein I
MTPSNPRERAAVPPDAVRPGPESAQDQGSGRREIWNEIDQSSIMSVELIAAILTWGGIGWLVDRWLGTAPWLFGIGVLVGFAAGLYLVWHRSGKNQDYPNGAAQPRPPDQTKGR